MKFFQHTKTKEISIPARDDDERSLESRRISDPNWKELTPKQFKKAMGDDFERQSPPVRRFVERALAAADADTRTLDKVKSTPRSGLDTGTIDRPTLSSF